MSGFGIEMPRAREPEISMKATWKVEELEEGDAFITCHYCKNSAIVHLHTWLTFNTFPTRSCTYCYKTAKVPGGNE